MDKMHLVITVLLVALIVFSGAQAVQLANIKAQVGGAAISTGSAYQTQAPAQQQARPAQTQSAMVGGC